jgi:hypothetical protein
LKLCFFKGCWYFGFQNFKGDFFVLGQHWRVARGILYIKVCCSYNDWSVIEFHLNQFQDLLAHCWLVDSNMKQAMTPYSKYVLRYWWTTNSEYMYIYNFNHIDMLGVKFQGSIKDLSKFRKQLKLTLLWEEIQQNSIITATGILC